MLRHMMMIAAGLLVAVPAAGQTGSTAKVRWEPYSISGSDGKPLAGELGRIDVPENRRATGELAKKTIEIAFVRFKSTNPNPGPPIFYLVGGPGPSGVEHCVRVATGRNVRLIDYADVIGIDQRGTGRSRPNLEEGPSFAFELPLDRAITREEYIAAYAAAAKRCATSWRERGVDLAAFNTEESAADVEDVRRALGLEKVTLWGESYGTHLGLAYLRKHSAHVARAALFRVEGPDHTLKLPSTSQRYLEQMHDLVAADDAAHAALPDVLGTVDALLAKLEKEPVTVSFAEEGESRTVTVGAFDLRFHLANTLGLAFRLVGLPAELARMSRGDFGALGPTAYELRRGEIGSAMAMMMDCASGASPERLARIERERLDPKNRLGDAANVPYPAVGAACGAPDLGAAFRSPTFRCAAAVLFVSGTLDAKTPPENVDEIRAGFTAHAHVIAENAGHESIEVLSPEFRALLADFMSGKPVESRTITLPQPRFKPVGGQ